MAKTVRDAMTSNPRTTSSSQSLKDAAQIMKSEDVGSVPVVDEGRLVGVVTDRDITIRGVAEGADARTTNVGDVASRDPVTVEPAEDLDEALALMARHRVRRLMVVESGRLVGILAQADVAEEVKEKKTGELVEEISKPS
jgi:CBS domain-containing protein